MQIAVQKERDYCSAWDLGTAEKRSSLIVGVLCTNFPYKWKVVIIRRLVSLRQHKRNYFEFLLQISHVRSFGIVEERSTTTFLIWVGF